MARYYAGADRMAQFQKWREQRNLDAAGQGPQAAPALAPDVAAWQQVAQSAAPSTRGPRPMDIVTASPEEATYRALARRKATEYGVDADIFERQIGAESSWNPRAISPAGALGLGQIMPQFHPGVDYFNPESSLDYSAKLMRGNLDRYGGDYGKALASYNAGPGAVDEYGGIPPFPETQAYVNKILRPPSAPLTSGASDIAPPVPPAAQIPSWTPPRLSVSDNWGQSSPAITASSPTGQGARWMAPPSPDTEYARPTLVPGSPVDMALKGMAAAQRYAFDPISGLATETIGGAPQAAYEQARGVPAPKPTSSIPEWWTGFGERQAARREAGVANWPVGDVLPLTPMEYKGVGQAVAQGLRGVPREATTALKGMASTVAKDAGKAVQPATKAATSALFVPPEAGGMVLGGAVGAAQPAETEQEQAQNIVKGAAGGALLGSGARAAGKVIASKGKYGPYTSWLGVADNVPAERGLVKTEGEVARAGGIGGNGGTSGGGRGGRGNAGGTGSTGSAGGPYTEQPGFAGNIRLEKYPEAVRPVLKAWADANPEKWQAARRGVVSDEEVRALASDINADPKKVKQAVRNWHPGVSGNAEELLAVREALAASATDIAKSVRAIQAGGNSDEALLKLMSMIEEHGALQETVTGVTAEAGRALRQFRQEVTGALNSSDAKAISQVLKDMGGRDSVEARAAILAGIDLDNPTQVSQAIRAMRRPRFKDYLNEIYINSIVSGPRSHLANVLGNTLSSLLTVPERTLSAAWEIPISTAARRPRERLFGEATKELVGLARGIPEAGQALLFTLRNGYTPEASSKLELMKPGVIPGIPGKVLRAPTMALAAEDAVYYAIINRGVMNANAYRMASKEGLKGRALADKMAELLTNPPDSLLKAARAEADYRLFRQKPGPWVQSLMRLRGLELFGIEPLRFVLPFIQTPANVTKYGLERSPLGLLDSNLYRQLAKGSPDAADKMARLTMGGLIAAAIVPYVLDGRITGDAPREPAARDAFYRQGKQPFSIKIGDQWVQYQKLEPLNQTLSQVAAAVNAINDVRHQGAPATDVAARTAMSIGSNLINQTYMQNLADAMQAMQDPEHYGGPFIERVGAALVNPASGLGRTIVQAQDNTIRSPRGFGENIASTVPGMADDIPPRLDAFGEMSKRESPWYSPITWATATKDPVERELARLRVNVGFVGRSISGSDLSREQQTAYQRIAGPMMKQDLAKLVRGPRYARMSDHEKSQEIERTITDARQAAKDIYLARIGPAQRKVIEKAAGNRR